MEAKQRRVLGICGSLRQGSANRLFLEALAQVAPQEIKFQLFGGLGELPFFNPDLDPEGGSPPVEVQELRRQLAEADAVVIATPEIVHGPPGLLKNAIDWAVSSGSFSAKPVVLVTVSAGPGEQAQAILSHTLEVLEAKVVHRLSLHSGKVRRSLDQNHRSLTDELTRSLEQLWVALAEAWVPLES
ncbi:MAG: hypothetical protein A2600_12510 [Candidatus Lambdaproteobacteria bacterium RIFOXYD1_FULL_56_27]|uniref:NADPH-dependent FMN reductase-like domain-containing protein n=1 Tax=Candidatus Lambdaproteobacteria bacterium RIFOXYD2_FULL_56_26 TaxID=1817773 RepID=A0A1F6GSU8_9PROT|nr:MAG: hypothetical protein A2426_07185 [Candidatus Lambdaproteobacteria bacterium RIFOXYC1_FULL_56_13]OGH01204.1 MAG: hypothetical protein A2557_00910 [Candidatus Lambdaproteobacteria bacterium RIFOXYD2_FULL_56_26]OGH06471.1 MAG: hypothetical protein A2600_12510 [Candidatus Lambdaproteobacteria bacterium RIFOXYD1_FULL_56_27]